MCIAQRPQKVQGIERRAVNDHVGRDERTDFQWAAVVYESATTRSTDGCMSMTGYTGGLIFEPNRWFGISLGRNKLFMALMPVDPLLRNLHSSSRFEGMLAKLKLDEWKRR